LSARSLDLPGVTLSRRSAALAAPVDQVSIDPTLVTGGARLVFMRRIGVLEAPAAAAASSLGLFRAGGQIAEADTVLRRALASGRPFDEIEIACAHEDQALLAWEKALRHGWPVTLATGVPAGLTQPGRALAAYCRWLERDLSARVVIDALQDGAWWPALGGGEGDGDRVTASQAARVLARSAATWGPRTYGLSLSRLIAREGARAADLDLEAAARERAGEHQRRARRVLAWITALVEGVPATDQGEVIIAAVVEAARRAVAGMASRASALDRLAAVALDGALAELLGLGGRRAPLSSALRFIEEQVAHLRIGRDRPRPGHLHIGLLRDAGLDGRPVVFAMGLEEGLAVPAAIEDAILLDEEREALSPALATSRSRIDDAVGTLTRRLAELGAAASAAEDGRLTLSYSCRDVRQFRDTMPTSLVLQAFRASRGVPDISVHDMDAALGVAETSVPRSSAEAANAAEWWLHAVRDEAPAPPDVEAHHPWLKRGREVEALRGDDLAGPADGIVPAAGAALDPSLTDMVVSASTLEHAAECPFRYFVQYGLGVRPPDEREREATTWLDPLTRGSAMHELFARLMREVRDQAAGAFDARVHGPRLRALGDEVLARLRDEMPPPSDTVYDRERDDFLNDLDLFVQQQARRASRGIGFEVAFGMDDEGRDVAWGQADPIVIDLGAGRRLRVRGSIDRIDQLDDGAFEVIDYKTGSYYAPAYAGTFAGATRLQHAIYALAAEQALASRHPGARVVRSTYWFPSARGRQAQKTTDDNTATRTVDVLRDVCDTLAAGAFLQADGTESCKFCDFNRLCGHEPFARAKRKLAHPANVTLSAILRMRRHA
jgi:ATP-dependent helicase/nuclease subunit B